MSYSKTVYFIPVWFDDFQKCTDAVSGMDIWMPTKNTKVWAKYLYHYAANVTKQVKSSEEKERTDVMGQRDGAIFASYTLKNPEELKVYMFADKLSLTNVPTLREVRFSAFATGVGFFEFWVEYQNMTPEEIAEFAYHFKKAKGGAGVYKKENLPEGEDFLYNVTKSLLPKNLPAKLFFSWTADLKYECNCFHFLHVDDILPEPEERKNTLFRLGRSYRSNMPVAEESEYDMIYEAGTGDYWSGSPEGLANIVYDYAHDPSTDTGYYLHKLKLPSLETTYYFMYLLLLNQKYSAVQYINMVALSLERSADDVEQLNKRIVRLKNMFAFNVVSDDSIVQNVYSKMYKIMEIKSLLEDVIENENQLDYLQNSKQVKADLVSNKYLFGLSILTLFSAAVDLAGYIDRYEAPTSIATWLSTICVLGIAVGCAVWAWRSIKKR